ncbi:MAG TPA: site-specific DNA-methyltransferase [Solirubrobacteraceae bacterium]|nr:site-specific DNA-methyltransferase [Solirubrobacteraceae bacterium]
MNRSRNLSLYHDDTDRWRLLEADALLTLAKLPDACIDAIVTDPPYGIAFGAEAWDGTAIRESVRRDGERLSDGEAFERWTRVWASEAARVLKPGGYMVAFGAPRTFHLLTCGVERAGLEIRDVLMWLYAQGMPKSRRLPGGLGTALKPAYEPILLARAPLVGTTPRNLDSWGTGALNTEASSVGGYWPANVALSHDAGCTEIGCSSECPAGLLDAAHPERHPSRMFFCAKTTRREREAGCEQLPIQSVKLFNGHHHPARLIANIHPTVKPIELMRWLVRLITPPDGIVLDPFCGSGSTGAAAVLERRQFLGIERESKYIDIACARITHWAHESVKESA